MICIILLTYTYTHKSPKLINVNYVVFPVDRIHGPEIKEWKQWP